MWRSAATVSTAKSALLAAVLLLAACQTASDTPTDCVRGTLTDEGATCQALRDRSGQLYTFYADMTGYKIGQFVCVCGPVAQMSFCNQGTVLETRYLGASCPALDP